jgi:hypothetical protein
LGKPAVLTWRFATSIVPENDRVSGGKRTETDEDVQETATDWLHGLAADFYDEGIVNRHRNRYTTDRTESPTLINT